jgi:hypothetical protein
MTSHPVSASASLRTIVLGIRCHSGIILTLAVKDFGNVQWHSLKTVQAEYSANSPINEMWHLRCTYVELSTVCK